MTSAGSWGVAASAAAGAIDAGSADRAAGAVSGTGGRGSAGGCGVVAAASTGAGSEGGRPARALPMGPTLARPAWKRPPTGVSGHGLGYPAIRHRAVHNGRLSRIGQNRPHVRPGNLGRTGDHGHLVADSGHGVEQLEIACRQHCAVDPREIGLQAFDGFGRDVGQRGIEKRARVVVGDGRLSLSGATRSDANCDSAVSPSIAERRAMRR